MIQRKGGVWYPDGERGLPGDQASLEDIESHILDECASSRIAVQAGGAVGLWPAKLAEYFDLVHTFEPNSELFACLEINCPGDNVERHNAALGKETGTCVLTGSKSWNYGSWAARPDTGKIQMMTIDGMNLPHCDLIMLDIEGGEMDALQGAIDTIQRYHPTIVVELKQSCLNSFGYSKEMLKGWLKDKGYAFVKAFHGGRDELWKPRRN